MSHLKTGTCFVVTDPTTRFGMWSHPQPGLRPILQKHPGRFSQEHTIIGTI